MVSEKQNRSNRTTMPKAASAIAASNWSSMATLSASPRRSPPLLPLRNLLRRTRTEAEVARLRNGNRKAAAGCRTPNEPAADGVRYKTLIRDYAKPSYGNPNVNKAVPAATATYCFPSTAYVIGDE